MRRRAGEIAKHNEQLMQFNRTVVGGELRMIALKTEINELYRVAGQPARYAMRTPGQRASRVAEPPAPPPERERG